MCRTLKSQEKYDIRPTRALLRQFFNVLVTEIEWTLEQEHAFETNRYFCTKRYRCRGVTKAAGDSEDYKILMQMVMD